MSPNKAALIGKGRYEARHMMEDRIRGSLLGLAWGDVLGLWKPKAAGTDYTIDPKVAA
ncbi:MAG TPA: hypothetical protein PL033_20515 [Candidatus Brocadiia bacterium]|nr:hypothetical protein [Candidatus Brocadiia bacterium]